MTDWHPAMPLEYRNQIVTGDARELAQAIPDESVDLIFTDPVYDRIDDYRWLAETAARVLKPDSACLVWIANHKLPQILAAMLGPLSFVLPLSYIRVGSSRLTYGRRVFGWAKICLWLDKGFSIPHTCIPDTTLSTMPVLGSHKWNKNPEAMYKWLLAFTHAGATVYDPFTGGGTVPAVCKMLGRNYIASEIDPDTAERARQRVLTTQPPLFVLTEEQATMEVLA